MKLIDTNSPRACPRRIGERNIVHCLVLKVQAFTREERNPVVMALRTHLFPYRTQKLSSIASMVLGGRPPGRVDRCRIISILWLHGQAVKTPPFHGGIAGSIPAGVTKNHISSFNRLLYMDH